MSGRTWSVATMLALAVALPAAPVVATAASAAPASHSVAAPHGSDDGDGQGSDHKSDKGKAGKSHSKKEQAQRKFNLGGSLTAVDAVAGTATFRVHGGKFKALRGTELTVVLADGARVRRNDAAATLADFQVGDKVRAKGLRVDGVWTAKMFKGEGAEPQTEPGDDDGGTTPTDGGTTPTDGGTDPS
ncbi:MAG TPA: hypothetical protein VNC22_20250 [Sporichthya sp.]|nr:hypothetical protein [Sporichthya sp.]